MSPGDMPGDWTWKDFVAASGSLVCPDELGSCVKLYCITIRCDAIVDDNPALAAFRLLQ